ncbi:unnamed protein product, partial [Rotaria sp. Silwood2]
MRSEFRYPVI